LAVLLFAAGATLEAQEKPYSTGAEPYHAYWETMSMNFRFPPDDSIIITFKRDAQYEIESMTVAHDSRTYTIGGRELSFATLPEPAHAGVSFAPGPNGGTVNVALPYYQKENGSNGPPKVAFILIRDMSTHEIDK
jgi:hypothetical protein